MRCDFQIYKTTKALKMFPSVRLYIKHKEKVENESLIKNPEALVKTTKEPYSSKLRSPELFIYKH